MRWKRLQPLSEPIGVAELRPYLSTEAKEPPQQNVAHDSRATGKIDRLFTKCSRKRACWRRAQESLFTCGANALTPFGFRGFYEQIWEFQEPIFGHLTESQRVCFAYGNYFIIRQ